MRPRRENPLSKPSRPIYQRIREKRVTAILTAANGLTRIHALKTLKDKLFAFWILPLAGDA
jgi:hypothetical protein